MDDRSQAELNILIAADRWAREVMRADKVLNPVDQALLDAVLHYQRLSRGLVNLPVEFPKDPGVPNDLFLEDELTLRYSEVPTVKSPPFGVRQVKGLNDIILDEELFDTLHSPFHLEDSDE